MGYRPRTSRITRQPGQPLSVRDVSVALQEVLNKAMPCLRHLSPFMRALEGTLETYHLIGDLQLSGVLCNFSDSEDLEAVRRDVAISSWRIREPVSPSSVT